jgi:broad specificity phosphatase PhoE
VKFVVVCQGQTQQAANGDDRALSQSGLSQARAIAREIGAVTERERLPDAVFTGTQPAAEETARQIVAELGAAEPQTVSELDNGALGPEAAGIQDRAFVQERAWALIESLREHSEQDATIVLVTNEAVVRALVSRVLNLPPGDMWRFALEMASITTIVFRGQRTLIGSLNEVCHLENTSTGNK